MLDTIAAFLQGLVDLARNGIVPRRRVVLGPIKSATLPPIARAAVAAALKAGEDPAEVLLTGWGGDRTGLDDQAAPKVVAQVPIGTELPLAVEPDGRRDRDRVLVGKLGYLPSVEELAGSLKRGWVHCWLAERRPNARHPAGAAIVFVAIYDPS